MNKVFYDNIWLPKKFKNVTEWKKWIRSHYNNDGQFKNTWIRISYISSYKIPSRINGKHNPLYNKAYNKSINGNKIRKTYNQKPEVKKKNNQWKKDNRKAVNKYRREYYQRDMEIKRTSKMSWLEIFINDKRTLAGIKSLYKFKNYEEIINLYRNGKCKVCGMTNNKHLKISPMKTRLHIDHDHQTGKVRGLLCHWCNASLGYAGDSIERLDKLKEYLIESKTKEV